MDDLWPRRVPWDGKALPFAWGPFVALVDRLTSSVEAPDEFRQLAQVTLRKIATVSRMPGDVYVQAGLAQIGLELGWRLPDPSPVAEFYQLMPVDLGVVFMFADVNMTQERNRSRGRNFASRVPRMDAARLIGHRVLTERGVPVLLVDTAKSVEESRAALYAFIQ